MRKRISNRSAIVTISILLIAASLWLFFSYRNSPHNDPAASIALILPDGAKTDTSMLAMLAIWTDAAREEGLRLDVISASDFLRPGLSWQSDYAGVILPDTISQNASAAFSQGVIDYTKRGGKLMLVFDAATHTKTGAYYPRHAPLSDLAGIEYALYDTLSDHTIALDNVWGDRKVLNALGIPPGKSMPFTNLPTGMNVVDPRVLSGYQYGALSYNSYVTRGKYTGQRLLSSASGGLVAGYRAQGKGGVLFVNLPLGYLKGQTDGLLLHGFLRYFSDEIVALPTLAAAPKGRGGLIFNWHVDSNAAIAPIEALENSGMLKQGPFSIHFTAGPDARQPGDGLGLNLANNAGMQRWVARFKARGDALGNHGGWVHDYFGLNVTENNQADMQQYLEMNNQVMGALNGAPVREYSAPVGTQPKWVTKWLEEHGFVAYYFTGNSGVGATRSYREGKLSTPQIWSFPVLTFGKFASFEEADEADVAEPDMAEWLRQITQFSADSGVIRTMYSHPPGFRRYPQAIREWFLLSQKLIDENKFRWYTMTQVADFLNRREQTVWHADRRGDAHVIEASNPTDLADQTWKFPKARYAKPVLEIGQGVVTENSTFWMLSAGTGKTIRISSKLLKGGQP